MSYLLQLLHCAFLITVLSTAVVGYPGWCSSVWPTGRAWCREKMKKMRTDGHGL